LVRLDRNLAGLGRFSIVAEPVGQSPKRNLLAGEDFEPSLAQPRRLRGAVNRRRDLERQERGHD
jgi:hypothetical protein